jgi:hypothetical protein
MAESNPRNSPPSDADPHEASVLAAMTALADGLSPEARQRVFAALNQKYEPIPAPRAGSGEVLAEIVRLLPEQRSWTVEQIKTRVERKVAGTDPKAIYNALTYLKRRNDIVHDAYGRYTVRGIHFVTSDDLGGGPPTPHEQHDVET